MELTPACDLTQAKATAAGLVPSRVARKQAAIELRAKHDLVAPDFLLLEIGADDSLGMASGIDIGRIHEVSPASAILVEHGERLFGACTLTEVFAERLTQWRMYLARRELRAGASVSEAAAAVRYSSESAFSGAFKRVMAVAPGQYRRTAQEKAGLPQTPNQSGAFDF